ncbi:MAG: hypothetical protein AAFR04_03375 [Pseudomonadota bacterium]
MRFLIGLMLIGLMVVVGYWGHLSASIDDPSNDVWISLNIAMPAPMRRWGCRAVYMRSPDAPEPLGCEGAWQPLRQVSN